MRFFEHEDFSAAIVRAARHLELSEQFVEKDYYLTEILRITNEHLPGKVIFKGGTSLSKGWDLVQRFSEDIDLFVNPARFDPPLKGRAVDRTLRSLRDAVADHPALTYIDDQGQTVGGLGREDYFRYESRFDQLAGIPPTILLEPGIQSGDQPTADVEISSYLASYLRKQGQDEIADDTSAFTMTLLHFRRTFVEKLFTIHSKVERLEQDNTPIGRNARHYADLYALSQQDEVTAMLNSPEYQQIRIDYDERSRQYFPKSHRPPDDLRFSTSDALFPGQDLRERLEPDYEQQCGLLFYGPHASFEEVLERFRELRDVL